MRYRDLSGVPSRLPKAGVLVPQSARQRARIIGEWLQTEALA